jgi:hypothetical protein
VAPGISAIILFRAKSGTLSNRSELHAEADTAALSGSFLSGSFLSGSFLFSTFRWSFPPNALLGRSFKRAARKEHVLTNLQPACSGVS